MSHRLSTTNGNLNPLCHLQRAFSNESSHLISTTILIQTEEAGIFNHLTNQEASPKTETAPEGGGEAHLQLPHLQSHPVLQTQPLQRHSLWPPVVSWTVPLNPAGSPLSPQLQQSSRGVPPGGYSTHLLPMWFALGRPCSVFSTQKPREGKN